MIFFLFIFCSIVKWRNKDCIERKRGEFGGGYRKIAYHVD